MYCMYYCVCIHLYLSAVSILRVIGDSDGPDDDDSDSSDWGSSSEDGGVGEEGGTPVTLPQFGVLQVPHEDGARCVECVCVCVVLIKWSHLVHVFRW